MSSLVPTPSRPVSSLTLAPARKLRAFAGRTTAAQTVLLLTLWALIFAASLTAPPLLDDADATHAQAAQAMLHTGDWITLHVDGVRYLEKPPLPYWIAARSMAMFGETAFAIHLPLALTVLGLALLGYVWGRRAFNDQAAFYTALFLLTSAGTFLFTRIFIPDALLAFLLALALYHFLRALNPANLYATRSAYFVWIALALAVLTKGLVALVFFFATAIAFLLLTRTTSLWPRLKPFSGILLFLGIAAPWHILAGLRNTHGADGHGFFWFYFVNEHVLRFLGRRIPRDYNKLPALWYWTLHLVWLFPWSLFAPAAVLTLVRARQQQQRTHDADATGTPLSRLELLARRPAARRARLATDFTSATIVLLLVFSATVLVFFSLSTNQEYYTFPVYLPLLLLTAAALTASPPRRALTFAFAAFTVLGLAIAAALAYGLYSARRYPFVPDIGSVLAHRGIGQYTLSMSHFFDLTGPSFAALRLPAAIAALAFAIGPVAALLLRLKSRTQPAILAIALTSATFLVAAHIALVRFTPMLSSQSFAAIIQSFPKDTEVLLYGDQANGSSIPFYLHRRVFLIEGRSSSMLFGSTFPDAPALFLTPQQLAATWGTGPRKILFVPAEKRAEVSHLLGPSTTLLAESSGKLLLTDRPTLTPTPPALTMNNELPR